MRNLTAAKFTGGTDFEYSLLFALSQIEKFILLICLHAHEYHKDDRTIVTLISVDICSSKPADGNLR